MTDRDAAGKEQRGDPIPEIRQTLIHIPPLPRRRERVHDFPFHRAIISVMNGGKVSSYATLNDENVFFFFFSARACFSRHDSLSFSVMRTNIFFFIILIK